MDEGTIILRRLLVMAKKISTRNVIVEMDGR